MWQMCNPARTNDNLPARPVRIRRVRPRPLPPHRPFGLPPPPVGPFGPKSGAYLERGAGALCFGPPSLRSGARALLRAGRARFVGGNWPSRM